MIRFSVHVRHIPIAHGTRQIISEQAFEMGINHDDQGRGAICTDYDFDGRVDMATNGNSPPKLLATHPESLPRSISKVRQET
jgi:hypothetical protein